jgi:uncharacterized damage-inducible protein DinB
MKPLVTLALVLAGAGSLTTLQAQPAAPPAPSFRDQFLNQLKDVETKIVGLAEKMPQEKYSWRPAEGVRSISEVYMHIAGANYLFPAFLGVKPPAGIDRGMEKTVTEKAKVVEALRASFAHVREGVAAMSDADLTKATKMFGQQTTYQGVLLVMADHMHEHLGQSIAYARTNAVVPPWSVKGDS